MKEICLETERLILRRFRENDVEKCFQNFGQDKEIGAFLPMFPMKNVETMKTFIDGFIKAYVYDEFILLIEEKSSNKPIGYIGVNIPYEELNVGEISYLLGVNYQKHGYAYEAVNAVVNYMLNTKKIYMIKAKYNEQNNASGKLLEKIGFKKDGILRGRRINRYNGERCNLVVCSITKEDYK